MNKFAYKLVPPEFALAAGLVFGIVIIVIMREMGKDMMALSERMEQAKKKQLTVPAAAPQTKSV